MFTLLVTKFHNIYFLVLTKVPSPAPFKFHVEKKKNTKHNAGHFSVKNK